MHIVARLASAILTLAAVGYLAVCVYLYRNQSQFLFPGAFMPLPDSVEARGAKLGLDVRRIDVADGIALFSLQYRPANGAPVVILFHGNASYPEDYRYLYGSWIAAGYGIVAPAMRGYPRSGGEPDGPMMLEDALAVYDWTASHYPGHPVYVVGQSLGTGLAVHLAAHRQVAGVVLISPFLSMQSLVASKLPYLPTGWMLRSPFRSDLDMPLIKAPVLILHGGRDTLVPMTSARSLARLGKSPVTFDLVAEASHSDGLFTPETIDRIDAALGISPL
jgi:alpha-beta hydrolase superfamily lysophospholipase